MHNKIIRQAGRNEEVERLSKIVAAMHGDQSLAWLKQPRKAGSLELTSATSPQPVTMSTTILSPQKTLTTVTIIIQQSDNTESVPTQLTTPA